jgi:hypothetical protein
MLCRFPPLTGHAGIYWRAPLLTAVLETFWRRPPVAERAVAERTQACRRLPLFRSGYLQSVLAHLSLFRSGPHLIGVRHGIEANRGLATPAVITL